MSKVTFPVTITGMNITERGVEGRYGKQDKVGITIQQTNVIDENGQNTIVPAGAWLNGFCPEGAMNAVSVGSTIEVQIKTKAKGDGTFYYNFGYYPKTAPTAPVAAPVAQATPAPQPAPTTEYVTMADFQAAIQQLQSQIDDLSF